MWAGLHWGLISGIGGRVCKSPWLGKGVAWFILRFGRQVCTPEPGVDIFDHLDLLSLNKQTNFSQASPIAIYVVV